MLGVCLTCVKLEEIYKKSVIVFAVSMAFCVVSWYAAVDGVYNICAAIGLLAACASLEKCCPRIVAFVAKQNKACFLVYASHAGIILLLGRLYTKVALPENITSFYWLIVLLIYTANICVFEVLCRYCPVLLPYIAHHGRIAIFSTKGR